jgi:hypothetical protein
MFSSRELQGRIPGASGVWKTSGTDGEERSRLDLLQEVPMRLLQPPTGIRAAIALRLAADSAAKGLQCGSDGQ